MITAEGDEDDSVAMMEACKPPWHEGQSNLLAKWPIFRPVPADSIPAEGAPSFRAFCERVGTSDLYAKFLRGENRSPCATRSDL
jgi:hypothetical protein